MNLRKLPQYIRGVARAALGARPRDLGRALAGSPYVVRHIEGHDVSILLDLRDKAISRQLLYTGRYEQHVTEALCARLRPDSRFLDVGANLGYYSLLAARHCPEGFVVSLEPDPDNYRCLQTSIALNGFGQRVAAHELAASDREEELFLSSLGNTRNSGARFVARSRETLEAHGHNPDVEPRRVRAVRLDEFLGGETFDLVKVDIEGYEPNAFEGLNQTIRRDRPVILSEFAPGTIQHITGTDPRELLAFFFDLGYRLSVIEPEGPVAVIDTRQVMVRFRDPTLHHVDLLLEPAAVP